MIRLGFISNEIKTHVRKSSCKCSNSFCTKKRFMLFYKWTQWFNAVRIEAASHQQAKVHHFDIWSVHRGCRISVFLSRSAFRLQRFCTPGWRSSCIVFYKRERKAGEREREKGREWRRKGENSRQASLSFRNKRFQHVALYCICVSPGWRGNRATMSASLFPEDNTRDDVLFLPVWWFWFRRTSSLGTTPFTGLFLSSIFHAYFLVLLCSPLVV